MSRLAAPFIFALLIPAVFSVGSIAAAQNTPQHQGIKTTPEVLKLLADVQAALPKDDANAQAMGLFRLLNLEMQFEDKQPAAETLKAVLPLAPSLPEPQQNQLYAGLAVVYAALGQYDEGVKILGNIKQDEERSQLQLDMAVRISSGTTEKAKAFNTAALLNQAAAGAAAVKNAYTEALARVFLAKELSKQGKREEAAAAFAEARKNAKKLEEVEEQNVTDLLIRTQIEAGLVAEVLETLKSVSDADAKQMLTGTAAGALMSAGKTDAAEKLLKEIPPGEMKDKVIAGIASRYIQTLPAVQIKMLAAAASTVERKTQFVQGVLNLLLNANRDDVAAALSSELPDDAEVKKSLQNALQLKPLKGLLDTKKYDEAAALIDALNDAQLKASAKRQLAVLRFRETGDESFLQAVPATYSDEEKQQIEELEKRMQQASEMTNFDEQRILGLFQVLQAEYQLGNISAVKKIAAILFTGIDKQTDAVKSISLRFVLARLQLELNDKTGAIANMTQLDKTFSGVKDVMELKGLVPPKEEDNPIVNSPSNGPAVKLKVPPTKAEVEMQVFNVYLTEADILRKAGAESQSKAVLQKARDFADSIPDAGQKANMLFSLTQFLLQNQDQDE
jgi:tetratricopeptide (TPR) repeat protein